MALRSSLTLGYTTLALERFDTDDYVRVALALPMRETLLVPAMAASLVAEAAHRGWTLPEVEAVAVSGAATPPAIWRGLARVFPNAGLINTYTTTEAWPARASTVVDPEHSDSVGRPLDDQSIEIRDDAGRALGPFERGTIHLAHRAAAARRYADADVPSRASADGWIETDDLGYLDDEGFLYVEDRKSDVVATGGFTVSTLEVERALTEHPQVVEAAAFGLPHPVLGATVAACVVGPPDLDLDEVERIAREQLAAHKIPRLLTRVDSLPRSRGGKVAKQALRERLGAPVTGTAPASASASADEALIRAIWEAVLEQREIGVDQSFMAVGGDSLSAMRIVSRIRAELAPSASTGDLLMASTIAEQAQVVAAARNRR